MLSQCFLVFGWVVVLSIFVGVLSRAISAFIGASDMRPRAYVDTASLASSQMPHNLTLVTRNVVSVICAAEALCSLITALYSLPCTFGGTQPSV